MTAGKNASSELNATCCARPMQSSARNSLNVRLRTLSHSRALSRSGPRGTRPISSASAAVDKREAAGLRLGATLAAATGEDPHRRPEPAREEESRAGGTGREDGQLRAKDRGHVRRFLQLVYRIGELLSL